MKYKGSQFEYKFERDADLLRAYREQLAIRHNISLTEIASAIAKSPSRRFWVSEERAYIVVSDMIKGKSIETMSKTKQAMFGEIYRRYVIYQKQLPTMSKRDMIWHICNEEAPEFYLTPKSVIVILHKARKEEKKRCTERLRRRYAMSLLQ